MPLSTPHYLLAECNGPGKDSCYAKSVCPFAVKCNYETMRYFITMGHPGYNSRANNFDGYPTEQRARLAVLRQSAK